MKKITFYLLAFSLLASEVQGTEMDPRKILPNWDLLDSKQQEKLSLQFEEIDLADLARQRNIIEHDEVAFRNLSVFKEYHENGNIKDQEMGKRLLSEGKVGCLIVAGGQGSRLSFVKPKGFHPVTLIKEKCLFQLFAEKILAAGKLVEKPLQLAIMTSLENHEETVEGFKENNYFGLDPNQVYFFSQKNLPLLDHEGNVFLETPELIATGPDGNASSLREFVVSGIWDIWHKMGVSYLNYMHVDNALTDPFDLELSGFHSKNPTSDVIVKCIEREDPEEKLGVLFNVNGKVGVVEYTEISEEDRVARNQDDSLQNACGNIGIYSFSMNFVHDVATGYYNQFPFHKAWKSVKYLAEDGTTKKSQKPNAWKFEKFIFDLLPFAKNVKAVLYPRKECFAPLKNAEGTDSLSYVQTALQQRDREVFERISGTSTDNKAFELDPAFYYPTPGLLKKWKGKTLPASSYVYP
jgi:UDP-N-acetylglucosamine/UDP-N-acetylgalactosamine diphosphorylase